LFIASAHAKRHSYRAVTQGIQLRPLSFVAVHFYLDTRLE